MRSNWANLYISTIVYQNEILKKKIEHMAMINRAKESFFFFFFRER